MSIDLVLFEETYDDCSESRECGVKDYMNDNTENYNGEAIINNMKANPATVPVASSNGKNYVDARDLDNYSKASGINDPTTIIDNIASANNINVESIVVVGVRNLETASLLESYGVIVEKSSYSDAITIGQAKSWYRKFVAKCRSGIVDKKDLDERIKILEECIKQMGVELNLASSGRWTNDRVKYGLKAWIPFDSIVRFIHNRDTIAGWGLIGHILLSLVGLPFVGAVGQIGFRLAKYEDMLEEQIMYTQEAIDYLKSKRSEFK